MVHFKRSNSGTPDCGKPRGLRLWRGALRRIRTRSNGAGLPRMRDDMIGCAFGDPPQVSDPDSAIKRSVHQPNAGT